MTAKEIASRSRRARGGRARRRRSPTGPGGVSRLRSLATRWGTRQHSCRWSWRWLRPSGGDHAVNAVGESLALVEARRQVEARPAGAEARPARYARRRPRRKSPPTRRKLPPASAGSNGTHVPHKSSLGRDEIFAHRRGGDPGSTAILLTGVALAPPSAPEVVQGAINAANTIVGRPYVWGGGHASFYDNSYDCSGAVSFALFGGGLIPRPLTSGELMHWGSPGRRQMDHRLRQPRPYLRRDRRAALRHGRRRTGHRPALAPGHRLHRRLRRPPPAWVLARTEEGPAPQTGPSPQLVVASCPSRLTRGAPRARCGDPSVFTSSPALSLCAGDRIIGETGSTNGTIPAFCEEF